ncbi:MAG TPA: hypothetical protein VF660_06975 [Actinomycetota bacterium]
MNREVLDTLASGDAFFDLSSWRKISVAGSDAFAWLNDLVSVDLSGLRPDEARRSLLLSPTGRVQAEFTVTTRGGSFLLIQDPEQPSAIDGLLAKYVLSSDVVLEDRTDDLCLFAFPSKSDQVDAAEAEASAPSCVGPGLDLISTADRREALAASFVSEGVRRVEASDVEAWRVFADVPRFGVDVTTDDLPQEGGLEGAVAFGKGCYLGQEAVAKVRNLGHPRRVLLHVEASASVQADDVVCADGAEVGIITSAVHVDGLTRAFAKVRWDARNAALTTTAGSPLQPRYTPV